MQQGLSYWEQQSFFHADVVIVGSGIVGLNAAIAIKTTQPLLSVLVLERGFLPSGASTKNAGFACFGSISELIEQEKASGTDGLHQLITKRWQGLSKLRKLLGDKSLSFYNFGGYELFVPSQQELANNCVSKISHFNALIKDIVLESDVFGLNNGKIGTFGLKDVDLLIENKLEGQLNPGMMIKSLLALASSLGISVLNNCAVNAIEHEASQVVLQTNQGLFKSKKVLLCTNAFAKALLPDLALVPGRGQVVVTKPIPNLKLKGTFHYDKGFYYFRNIDNRVLLGGGRNLDFKAEETTDFGETKLVQDHLIQLLRAVILPETDVEIEYKWSGIMAFGPALSPIVEEVKPHVFCAVRCNGMGIAIGTQTGQDAAEMVLNSL
ncbi:FAD-binding oxidoreductase [Pedobacter sp. KR3-3]|uniref:FAD-binding oxidoreductase n=1 Tax=Pedobacter albus TaxID=3113905 RepID=A0ABU7ICW8_9SPHI|nr:FAD-binding oxidoreductase [Pedobacter sp. KR3-3]MEE1947325.1 FAD-binding oxidoreductase [Pedobacter sp. KR3-3]